MNTSSTKAVVFKKAAVFFASAFFACSSFAAPIPLINAGFETAYQGAGYRYLSGTVNGWTYTGRTGIAGNGSAFGVSNAPGNQAAFIQSDGSRISQSFNFTGGTFLLDFLAEYRRGYGGNTVKVMVDDQLLTFGGGKRIRACNGCVLHQVPERCDHAFRRPARAEFHRLQPL